MFYAIEVIVFNNLWIVQETWIKFFNLTILPIQCAKTYICMYIYIYIYKRKETHAHKVDEVKNQLTIEVKKHIQNAVLKS